MCALILVSLAGMLVIVGCSDNAKPTTSTGVLVIDDFEQSRTTEILATRRDRWTPASNPDDLFLGLDETNRGRMIWYNPINKVSRLEIWPQQEGQLDSRNNDIDTMVITLRGSEPLEPAWDGLMTTWTVGVRDFSQSKFLEIWVRGDEGILHIDLGDISEDYMRRDLDEADHLSLEQKLAKLRTGDGKLDTEDRPPPGRISGDGVVTAEEDIGIDGRTDEEELTFYLALAGADTSGSSASNRQQFRSIPEYAGRDPEDPEGDNWDFDERDDYSRINGTQGSGHSETQRPDSEDINNDGILNIRNDYFHHTIDLSHDPHVPGTRSPSGWRLFRLPLFDAAVGRVGSPDSSRIEYNRIILAIDAPMDVATTVEIAQIEIVANTWQATVAPFGDPEQVGEAESAHVFTTGTDTDLSYTPPPDLLLSGQGGSEHSLALSVIELVPGHEASVRRAFSLDTYASFDRLRVYAHGDTANVNYVRGDTTSELQFFIRLESDAADFYEYSKMVFPGWDERNHADAQIGKWLDLGSGEPQVRLGDSVSIPIVQVSFIDSGLTSSGVATYRVVGQPLFDDIRDIRLGIRNLSTRNVHTGTIYFDELRLEQD